MKTLSNSILMDRLHKRVDDTQMQLELKLAEYNEGLKAGKHFSEMKALRCEVHHLQNILKEMKAQLLISRQLAEYSSLCF